MDQRHENWTSNGPMGGYSSSSPVSETPYLFLRKFVSSNWLYVFIILSFELGFRCIVLNCTVFSFYFQRFRAVTRGKPTSSTYYVLYIFLSISDAWVGVTAFIHGFCLIFLKMNDLDSAETMCYILTFMATVPFHVSVFLNVIISVIRTFHIVRPTRQTSKKEMYAAYTACLLYTILWIVIAACDTHKIRKYNVASRQEHIIFMVMIAPRLFILHDKLVMNHSEILPRDSLIYAVLAIGLPYVLPSIICIITSTIQGYSLLTSKVSGSGNTNRRITTTIIILTACFFLCKVPYYLYFTIKLRNWISSQFIMTEETILCYFIATFPHILNAVLNPTVLILRGRCLKEHALSLVVGAKKATVRLYSAFSLNTVVDRS